MARKRHRITVQVTALDAGALDELCRVVEGAKRSEVIRAALRLGIAQLRRDPAKVYITAPPGRVEELRGRARRGR